MKGILYKKGYTYQLVAAYVVRVAIRPGFEICSDFIHLSQSGVLTIRKGYAWDGPSGPAFDTKNIMRGSLVHDALYQLMAEHGLSHEHRAYADQLLWLMCLDDGMSTLRAWAVHAAVRFGGGVAMARRNPALSAP